MSARPPVPERSTRTLSRTLAGSLNLLVSRIPFTLRLTSKYMALIFFLVRNPVRVYRPILIPHTRCAVGQPDCGYPAKPLLRFCDFGRSEARGAAFCLYHCSAQLPEYQGHYQGFFDGNWCYLRKHSVGRTGNGRAMCHPERHSY